MNVLDKLVSYINPNAGLRREIARSQSKVIKHFMNTGYSESGASTQKKSMKGWNSLSSSPEEDIDLNLFVLRNRCRGLYNATRGYLIISAGVYVFKYRQ
ncbi:hypothetical protein [Clostridium scatologenes]|uniref:Uncharacterized protein n=1 Tax=Clostridium scatologenes TaxID=1548 RepID=A0A0E3JSB7_CLOSL|nr:hypothetical protein [Clostridium scatologenes]AKA72217.1 hypothetical protein CSCA_5092 [Clostridium scatologenes]